MPLPGYLSRRRSTTTQYQLTIHDLNCRYPRAGHDALEIDTGLTIHQIHRLIDEKQVLPRLTSTVVSQSLGSMFRNGSAEPAHLSASGVMPETTAASQVGPISFRPAVAEMLFHTELWARSLQRPWLLHTTCDSEEGLWHKINRLKPRVRSYALRAPSVTQYLSKQQVISLLEAAYYTNWQGYVLNGFLTVTSCLLNPIENRAGSHFSRFRELANKWFEHRNVPWLAMYVWERGSKNGAHVHMLFHCPKSLESEFRAWMRKSLLEGTGHRRLPPHSVRLSVSSEKSVMVQNKRLQYLLKGLDPKSAIRDHEGCRMSLSNYLQIKPVSSGEISWKRVGFSQVIGRRWQDRHGFPSPFRERNMPDQSVVFSPSNLTAPSTPFTDGSEIVEVIIRLQDE
jgi:hypothetical protein